MMESYQEFIHTSRYARWRPEDKRRETWSETVDRYFQHWIDAGKLTKKEAAPLAQGVLDLEQMPSMRCMMTAGAALERDNVAGFNCSYLPINHPRCFDELMYILLCGTGVGYSVERKEIAQLPSISEDFHPTDTTIVVADSKVGWAKSFRQLLSLLWAGEIPKWDVSRVRPAGAPLRTFGGRASGPAPLVDLFNFSVTTFQAAAGRQLTDLEASDLCCKIAECIVVGGVRRSALICLSDPSSARMGKAKTGTFPPHRYLANMSGSFSGRPDFQFFLNYMGDVYESHSGERGIFCREAAKNVVRRNGRRDDGHNFGTNPCSEIILRPFQFCNLTEVVVRAEDTLETLCSKVEKAAILGTLQATLTNFRYLRKVWRTNTEDEALLGLSLTGIMDHPILSGGAGVEEWLERIKDVAIATNKKWAKKLDIKQSAAVTCVKPSGTVSQLVNSASGIHPRYAPYYIRTVRQSVDDPLTKYMIDAGFPHEEAVGSPRTMVFSFPVKAPEGAVCTKEVGTMEQLRLWKIYQDHWCEHKPSITVYYSDDEFLPMTQWVWENFDSMSGIAMLPMDDHVYQQAPYQEVDEETYTRMLGEAKSFDWAALASYEETDTTEASQTMACVGTSCEI